MATREHLFRGYSEEYGWVYGDNSDPHGNYPANIFPREDTANYDAYEGIAVDPETVCEFTGLTDKDGTKIFEGDIVKALKYNETPMVFPITFRSGCFWYGNWNFIEFLDKFRNTEVIGNIFDNPELIGGVKK